MKKLLFMLILVGSSGSLSAKNKCNPHDNMYDRCSRGGRDHKIDMQRYMKKKLPPEPKVSEPEEEDEEVVNEIN